ncbi:uncharacterized protein FOMMEDRAFT_94845, partial [Fomitiporia mediterranea MF3/22]|uniref:uncharacterized protein n=1 Tax=Fomitiporia mediterranea (strain MF3/22) TaxID=694068 RepID=UPI000440731D
VYFKVGKNKDEYFQHSNLIQQVDKTIYVFKELFSRATTLFTFDNVTTHSKQYSNTLSVYYILRNTCY